MNKQLLKKNFFNKNVNICNTNYYKEGNYYIVSSQPYFLTKKQIDSCLNVIRFFVKKLKNKKKKIITPIQFNVPITRKNKFSRMGAGKGKIKKYVSKISMNSIIFIIKDIKKSVMLKIYKYIQYKLPIKIYLKF